MARGCIGRRLKISVHLAGVQSTKSIDLLSYSFAASVASGGAQKAVFLMKLSPFQSN